MAWANAKDIQTIMYEDEESARRNGLPGCAYMTKEDDAVESEESNTEDGMKARA